jgi:predicted lipoprotein with Yx(FWY)xxD motif
MQRIALALPVVVVLLAGCGSAGPSRPAASHSPSAQAGSSSAGVVRTESTPIGTVLANSAGHTMYLLTADRAGKPTCSAACRAVWPPVLISAVPPVPSGVTATFGEVAGADGEQLTVDGYPAYTFVPDAAPGEARGEGIVKFGGTWYALGTTGKPIVRSTHASPTPSSTPSTSSGGYGY